jgi:hypothetical protein
MRKSVVAAVLTGLLLSLTGPLAAQAGPPPEVEAEDWSMAPCVVPHFSRVHLDTVLTDWVILDGSAVQCPPGVENAGFRLATYRPGEPLGRADGVNVRLFPELYPGQFPVRAFGAGVMKAETGRTGVCLLAGKDERVLCGLVSVLNGTKGLALSLTPLAVDAPLVNRGVVTTPYPGPGDAGPPGHEPGGNSCGTCF